ncbi:NAD(P)/FAD-dependent oxidoreductase [Pseudoduganella namucuonensis]|uniref:Pyruvate/2-oxoglutarate dehydrogenase complex, dihydrolipoamide dehydrogenase (E3) component n=1 Tax=Pseudoduganella namucuonensis TaxID=1035707 RepID=A0A1I7K633_9BURK|nr:FAD/NAD(P)-binding oxidoreductase [Pseudoduganella namucuonensis]SFU92864.1 Pyruvate/2-oxoglutarate dehydrogenase complex, dihydrolipoamide dehydrogenase (E3) component [Pseudoduganella namucuonensis]
MSMFDILVIGAGPAGLAAAHAAAAQGAIVGVVDDNPQAGGQIWRGGAQHQQDRRARRLWEDLRAARNVSFMHQARVLYPSGPGALAVQTPSSALTLRYQRLVIATGARELLLPFPGWTLPGVTGAGGLQALAKGGYPVTGKRVVVAGSGPLLLAVAATLVERGARVAAIVEQADNASLARFAAGLLATPSKIAQALRLRRRLRGIPYHSDSHVRLARGAGALREVEVQGGSGSVTIACDYLSCGYGLVPNPELALALGCATSAAHTPHGGGHALAVQADAWQQTSIPGVYCAGEGTGVGGVDKALAEGRVAGLAAAGRMDLAERHFAERAKWQAFAGRLAKAFALDPAIRALADDDTIVCRCEDVSHGELRRHDSWRSAKLHTRCGMGPCQGRVCGGATDILYGWRPESVRVPLSPARVDSIITHNPRRTA